MNELPFRQIHLDFHTSEYIQDVGVDFDPKEFADQLQKAHVASINLFARCHHGWIYYDTRKFPERRHPHLTCNLLKEQMDACHARGIRTMVYVPVQWDHSIALQHPEWLVVDEYGRPKSSVGDGGFYEPGFYRNICLNTPYVEFVKEFIKEVLEMLPCNGLWLDVVWPQECSCRYCREGMLKEGIDPSKKENRVVYGNQVYERFVSEMNEFVHQINNNCTVVYHSPESYDFVRLAIDSKSHLEWEGLPSAVGYDHFPITIRYFRNLKDQCVSLIGKFHTVWGDFHSFRNLAALEYECFRIIALNGKCSIGDQLHPRGRLCPVTYDLIGKVYSQIEAVEPWCTHASPVTEIAVLSKEGGNPTSKSLLGINRMLQECGYQFDILDLRMDFFKYKLLILPDEVPVDTALAKRLKSFVDLGGAVLASYRSGIDPDTGEFAPIFGISCKGPAPYSPDFIAPGNAVSANLPAKEYVMYMQGMEVKALPGTEILAMVNRPYFNRTWKHFMSHCHAPSTGEPVYPGIIRNGNVIYFAHPVFSQYQNNAPSWCKQLVRNAINLLLPKPLLKHNGPSSLFTSINEQLDKNRWVVHLLHYIPERRSDTIDVIEDVIPLHELRISIRCPRPVKTVTCVPEGQCLEFKQDNDYVTFDLPKLYGHQMVAIDFV